jgi:Streptomyces sporulation and cell division protein, SsgA
VTFSYATWDPFAVQMLFHLEAGPVLILGFARKLLHRAINKKVQTAGLGDISITKGTIDIFADDHIKPVCSRPAMLFQLAAPHGHISFLALRAPVAAFLAATYCLVARGSESISEDIEAALAIWLGAPELTHQPWYQSPPLPPPCI